MNWGKGITIFMIAFMGFIGSMVYFAFTKNADLVDEDYYENELAFDKTKKERQNYNELKDQVHVEKNERGITFLFPSNVNKKSEGKIEFYRPDQKKLDRSFDLEPDAQRMQQLPYDYFAEGYYDIKVSWTDEQKKGFIFESNIYF